VCCSHQMRNCPPLSSSDGRRQYHGAPSSSRAQMAVGSGARNPSDTATLSRLFGPAAAACVVRSDMIQPSLSRSDSEARRSVRVSNSTLKRSCDVSPSS
jgi:hypothetical protein